MRKTTCFFNLIFFSWILLFSSSAKPLELNRLAVAKNFTLKQNLHMGYTVISSREGKSLKLFLTMPYIVFEDSIYYLEDKPQINDKGGIEISPAALGLIDKLLANAPPKSSSSSSVSEKSSFTQKSNENRLKDDQKEKTNYNSDLAKFIPIDSIVIDPGHGGKDPGGLGVNGAKEKEIVLSVSKMLYDLLKKDGKVKVYLTRKNDRYITLKERTDRTTALLKKGLNPIFISVHGNISLDRDIDGIEIYSLSEAASDNEALAVESIENAGFSKNDIEKTEALFSIINDLLKDGIRRQSEKLSKDLGQSLVKSTGAPLRGNKKANFYVLKYNSLPAALVEVGFLSHSQESRKLLQKEYQKKIASGLYQGIQSFLQEYDKSRGFTK
jgi:N-acetylmuramoyl-L-alanine amidase